MPAELLPPVFESKEAAPDWLQPHLIEDNGKFVAPFDVEKHPKIQPLKNAYERVKESDRLARESLQGFQALGKSADELAQLATELEELRTKGGKGDEQLDAKLKQVQQKYDQKVAELEGRIGTKDQQIDLLVRETAAVEELTKAKGNVTLLKPHVMAQTKTMDVNGKPMAVVIDEKGNPRIADTLGTPMTIADLVAEMKKSDAFAAAFEGTGLAGTGAKPGGGGGSRVVKRSDLTDDAAKAAFVKAHGLEAYKALPA